MKHSKTKCGPNVAEQPLFKLTSYAWRDYTEAKPQAYVASMFAMATKAKQIAPNAYVITVAA